jgi:hypothetical protein
VEYKGKVSQIRKGDMYPTMMGPDTKGKVHVEIDLDGNAGHVMLACSPKDAEGYKFGAAVTVEICSADAPGDDMSEC